MIVVAVLALLCSIAALAAALYVARTMRADERRVDAGDLPPDVLALRQEVAALKLDLADSLRNVALVRYDAFTDSGGKLSWSLALVDDHGNGVVLTSIHGRTDARTYAKSILDWRCDQALSPEEQDAVENARPVR